MSKQTLVWPAHLAELNFDDLYLEISDHWQERAKHLQQRRWQKLKNEIKSREFGESEFFKLKTDNKLIRRSHHENVVERLF